MGVIQDMAHIEEALDRDALFARIFDKVADPAAGPGGASVVPLARAAALLSLLRGEVLQTPLPTPTAPVAAAAEVSAGAAGGKAEKEAKKKPVKQYEPLESWLAARLAESQWKISDAVAAALRAALPTAGALEHALSGGGGLQRAAFVSLLRHGLRDHSNLVLYLGAEEALGVLATEGAATDALAALHRDILDMRRELAAQVAASAQAHTIAAPPDHFSAASLAVLAADIGFQGDEAFALAYLQTNCRGGAAVRDAQTYIALRECDFVDFMSAAAAAAQVSPARVGDYLRVFRMLHLSGMRERAGVATVA
jgi:hypothetical protein